MLLRKETWLKASEAAAKAIAERGATLIGAADLPGDAGGYHPIAYELDPLPLLRTLHANGFRIALPRTGEAMLSFREWSPDSALERGKFGVLQPLESQPELHPAIVLVPLLAFDRNGNRLGYGAGYYDASLRDLRKRQQIMAIGIAFDEQEFPEIPKEPQDEPLDMILTPSRVIECSG